MRWGDGQLDVDDALITYRYAENLATGQGFVYNAGERLLGTSTPLYTLLLAGGHLLGVPTLTTSAVLNLLASLAVVWLTMQLTWRLSGSLGAALLAAAFLLTQGGFMRYSMAGMETPLYTGLLLLTFWAVVQERYRWAALIAGATAIMRLDGVAVGGALFLAYLLHQRRLPWPAIGIYAISLLPWALFALLYFGSPIPHSLVAKQGHLKVYGHSRYWIWETLFTNQYGAPTTLLAMLPIGLLRVFRRNGLAQGWTTIVIWLVAYLVAYTLVGIDFYEWYAVPAYPVLAIFVGIGLHTLWAALADWLSDQRWPRLAGYVSAAMILYWFIAYGQHVYASVTSFQGYLTNVEGPRNRAGQWLQAHTAPDATVYAGAIGHVGYFANRYLFDGAGLVTLPEQLQSARPDYYAVDGWVPDSPDCGLFKEFLPPAGADNPPMLISACHQTPLAEIGGLSLAYIRIGQQVRKPNRYWTTLDKPLLELQWHVQQPVVAGEWAVYMHYLDAEGHRLMQSDHQLGRQIDGSVYPVDQWQADERIYTYVGLPDEWDTQADTIAALRLGVWNPATQEYLPITTQQEGLRIQEGLLVPLQHGEFQLDR